MELPTTYSDKTSYKRRLIREEYIRRQDNKCYFCSGSLSEKPIPTEEEFPIRWELFPPNFLKYPVHLQHCHETDMTEGAVHAFCNAVMWQYYGR